MKAEDTALTRDKRHPLGLVDGSPTIHNSFVFVSDSELQLEVARWTVRMKPKQDIEKKIFCLGTSLLK